MANAGFAAGLAGFIALARQQSSVMRDIIERRHFALDFQRVVNLGNRAVSHFEALLRPYGVDGMPWSCTQDFVTCAEALGLAEELDLAVLEQVLAVLSRLSNCSIAANISGCRCKVSRFASAFSRCCQAAPIDACLSS